MSGAAELVLLLALLEVREAGLRVPAFFLKTLKKKKLVREKGRVTLQTDNQNVEKKLQAQGHTGTETSNLLNRVFTVGYRYVGHAA